jgi:hypothetical protein
VKTLIYPPTANDASVDAQLEALETMTVTQLRARYAEVFGEQTTSGNRQWLYRRVAWRIQALAYGGLSERARQRAAELARDADVRVTAPRLHIETCNEHVQQIARQELAALCRAVGVASLTDTRDLLHKHARITLGIRRRDDGDTTNVVRAYAAATTTTLHQN